MSHNHSSSDDDEDVVVLRVCGNRNCQRTDNVQMDEETSELYCAHCRSLFARSETEGFRVLLSDEERPLVALIFSVFDDGAKGFWSFNDWAKFQAVTDHPSDEIIDSGDALENFFSEEYDISLGKNRADGKHVVWLSDLENMYGGFFFNQIDALTEDANSLEEQGIVNTEVLE